MNRMTTGMRGGMQTGYKIPQSRLQSGMVMDAQFTGLSKKVNINNRPVTKDGVSGIPTLQVQDNRTVVDRSYVIQQLREKLTNICDEIDNFKKKIENMSKDNTLYQNLDKKYEDLTKEVRELEGKLADYNLSFDKQRAGTSPEEIRNMFEHIKMQNDRWRSQLDEIFIERKSQEEQIQAIEQQLTELNEIAESKINELLPEQKSEYESLINENKQLGLQINNSRQELEDINQKLVYCENKLRMDSHKLKGQLLREQITEFEQKKNDLELQLNEANLPFDQARDRLLARIKEDNIYIQNTEKRVREIKKNIDNYEKKLREIGKEENNGQSAEEQKKKYEAIFEKDKEFNEFFDNYGKARSEDLEKLHTIEQNIVELLQESSKYLSAAGALPSASEYTNLKKELGFKENQNEVSSETLVRMQQEYKLRQEDVQKLQDAEERVDREMNNLKEKMTTMKDEISTKYDKADSIKNELESKRKSLIKDRDDLKYKKTEILEEIKKVKFDHDVKEKKMTMNEMYSQFTEAENKAIQLEKDIENLKSFILTKAKDMDYQALSEECKIMADELNKQIIKNI